MSTNPTDPISQQRAADAEMAAQPPQPAELPTLAHDANAGPAGAATLPPEGSALPDDSGAAERFCVPGYEVLGKLGQGGMGVVYRARHQRLGRVVALKMVLHAEHANEQELARFLAEAEAIAHLQHVNIVQLFDSGTHNGLPYFTLEFVPGGSLADRLRDRPLEAGEAARLVEAIARGVQHAHEKGIIHRDLKPANVLLAREPSADLSAGRRAGSQGACDTPKVTDFGLARRVETGNGLTATGAVMGTPSYMAPEQAGGDAKKVGPAADVYALGAILYECLTGRPPFRAATPLDTMLQVLGEEPVPPRQLNRQLPRDLETICLKCLRKDPANRYASAEAMAEDLARFLRKEPITARPVGALERSWGWCRRNPALAGSLATVVLSLVAGTLVSLAFAFQASENARRASANAVAATEAAAEAERRRGDAERLLRHSEWLGYVGSLTLAQREWSDGESARARELLHAARWDFRAWEHDYLRNLFLYQGQQTVRRLPAPPRGLAVSPDGRRVAVAYPNQTGTPDVVDLQTGRIALTLERPPKVLTGQVPVVSVAFSPDGRQLAGGTAGGLVSVGTPTPVQVWDTDTGKLLYSLRGHARTVNALAYSPDGGRFASVSGDMSVRVWDAQLGRQLLQFQAHQRNILGVCFSPDGKHLITAGEDRKFGIWNADTGAEVRSATGHEDGVSSVSVSPHGGRFASGSWDGTVRVWDRDNGTEMHMLRGHRGRVASVCFLPDGKRLASAGEDGSVRLWEPGTPDARVLFRGHAGLVVQVCPLPDGRHLASVGGDGLLKVWDTLAGQGPVMFEPGAPIRCAAFHPGGRRIVTGHQDASVVVWDADTRQKIQTLQGVWGRVDEVCFSPDGKRLLTASDQPILVTRKIQFWNAETGEEEEGLPQPLRNHAYLPRFSPDGKILAVVGGTHAGPSAGRVNLWEVGTKQPLRVLEMQPTAVADLAFTRDGRHLAVAIGSEQWEQGHEVVVWNVANGTAIARLAAIPAAVLSVAFTPDGHRLLVGSRDRTVVVWNIPRGQVERVLRGHADAVTAIVCLPDGQRLLSAGRDRVLKVWDLETGQEMLTLKGAPAGIEKLDLSSDGRRIVSAGRVAMLWDGRLPEDGLPLLGHQSFVTNVAFSPDGQQLASAGGEGTVRLWDLRTGQPTATLTGHTREVYGIALSLDAKQFVSAGLDGIVKLWDARAGTEVRTLGTHTDGALSVAFSPDGRRVVSGGRDRLLKVWDTVTGQQLHSLSGHADHVRAVGWSPDGRCLASGSYDRTVKLWDAATGQLLHSCPGHPDSVLTVAFSPDSTHLASGSGDPSRSEKPGQARVWEVATGRSLHTLAGHEGPVRRVCFSPDGRWLLSGGDDDTVVLWHATSGEKVRSLRGGQEAIYGMAVSADGRRLATAGKDQTVKVWPFPSTGAPVR